MNIRNKSLANTMLRLCVYYDKPAGQHYIQRNMFCVTVVISCVQFDNSILKPLRCVIGQEHIPTVNMSLDLQFMCAHSSHITCNLTTN
jgi:hypothetical protein